MDVGWARALEPVRADLDVVCERVDSERATGEQILPDAPNVLRAFERPFDEVRVVIVGQDPYPTPGHAVGLAFSVDRQVAPLPPSLRNILQEWHDDLGHPLPPTGDLSRWAEHGVLLLNRTLTVRAGQPGSHARIGWEPITRHAISALARRSAPLVAILWGAHAQTLRPQLGNVSRIESAHPSPLSVYRGFWGSRPFSRANDLLREQGASPVDWTLS